MLDFEVGDTIADRYEIKKVLGVGGMGKVFLAKQVELGRDVALKVPSQAVLGNPEVMARFSREAKTVGKLMHDNIVQVYEYYHEAGLAFIAMEFVQGDDLKGFVMKPPKDITVGDVATILEMSCEGIGCAHDHGIIHRDIKPHNIMVGRQKRGRWRVKVMDFGIAHIDPSGQFTEVGDGQLTQTGQALGTPSYMAPEQIRGSGVSHLSDLYSFGCVIYYVFTRKTIFSGSGLTVAVSHLNEQPPSILSQLPKLPVELDRLVNDCLEKDPALRPQEAGEIGNRLTEALRPIWDMPMKEFWKETLQAPNALIPIAGTSLADKEDSTSEPSGKLIEVKTQGTLGRTGLTDDPKFTGGTLIDHTNDQTLPSAAEVPATRSVPNKSFPSPAKSPSTSQDQVGTLIVPSLTESIEDQKRLTSEVPVGGQGALPAPKNNQKPILIIAGLGVAAVLVGLGIALAMKGSPKDDVVAELPKPTATPAQQLIEASATATPTETQVAIAIKPTPTPEPITSTPAAKPTATPRPTATPEPSPTPSPTPSIVDTKRRELEIYRNMAENEKAPLQLANAWALTMGLRVDGEREFNEEVLNQADAIGNRMALYAEMVSFVSGSFTMGREDGATDERPLRPVTLSGYEIGKYEVTALEFATFLNKNSLKAETLFTPTDQTNVVYDESLKRYIPRQDREAHPANGISWNAANAYVQWLRNETGKLYRLPTEAEWERAVRDRTQNIYPWGNSQPNSDQANFNNRQTVAVNAYSPGLSGMFNMSGNVCEWVQDWYDAEAYRSPEKRNPKGPSDSDATERLLIRKVHRGGSYLSSPEGLIITRRGREIPSEQREEIGFRLALTPN